MPDLDMSDVLADAQNMQHQYYSKIMYDLDQLDDTGLRHEIYYYGIEARRGRPFGIDVLRMAEYLLLTRINTTLCEGCLDRTGCDMCCPPDFGDDYYSSYDQDEHYERFGRPALPNEY